MPVTKAGRASLGQKRTSSAGHGLWQWTRRAVSGGISAICGSALGGAGAGQGVAAMGVADIPAPGNSISFRCDWIWEESAAPVGES